MKLAFVRLTELRIQARRETDYSWDIRDRKGRFGHAARFGQSSANRETLCVKQSNRLTLRPNCLDRILP